MYIDIRCDSRWRRWRCDTWCHYEVIITRCQHYSPFSRLAMKSLILNISHSKNVGRVVSFLEMSCDGYCVCVWRSLFLWDSIINHCSMFFLHMFLSWNMICISIFLVSLSPDLHRPPFCWGRDLLFLVNWWPKHLVFKKSHRRSEVIGEAGRAGNWWFNKRAKTLKAPDLFFWKWCVFEVLELCDSTLGVVDMHFPVTSF